MQRAHPFVRLVKLLEVFGNFRQASNGQSCFTMRRFTGTCATLLGRNKIVEKENTIGGG
jgi:hypothetical protein